MTDFLKNRPRHMTSWYFLLKQAMLADGEDFDAKACTMSDQDLSREFDADYGLPEGAPFTAWGQRWVYFPIAHDGREWVGHAPRHPCGTALVHQGEHPPPEQDPDSAEPRQ